MNAVAEKLGVGTGVVTAHFADGSTATADVLVGADGANSRVRRQYLPTRTDPRRRRRYRRPAPPRRGDPRLAAPGPARGDDAGDAAVGPRLDVGSAFAGRDALTAAISDGVGLAGRGLDQDALLDHTDDYVLWSVIADPRVLPVRCAAAEVKRFGLTKSEHPPGKTFER